MKTYLLNPLFVVLLILGVSATPAMAGKKHYRHHHSHGYYGHRHYHNSSYYSSRPRVTVGFYSQPYYSPYYYQPYRPYYYVAPRVAYPIRPVYSTRRVYREGSAYVNGSRQDKINVQRELARRGYYGGALDGNIGPRSRAAIRAYQVDKNLPVSGRIDGNLLRSLRLL